MKEKVQDKLKRFKDDVGIWWDKNGGTVLFWLSLGLAANGLRKGAVAYKKCKRLEHWTDHECVPKFNHNADVIQKNHERITALERQVNTLMEKALSETEGKETA